MKRRSNTVQVIVPTELRTRGVVPYDDNVDVMPLVDENKQIYKNNWHLRKKVAKLQATTPLENVFSFENVKNRLHGHVDISKEVAVIDCSVIACSTGESNIYARLREHPLQTPKQSTSVTTPPEIVTSRAKFRAFYQPNCSLLCGCNVLYFCDHCLEAFKRRDHFVQHLISYFCNESAPGVEVYSDGNLAILEVCGSEYPNFCRNLCTFARLFIESKTVDQDVENFFFYVLIETCDGCWYPIGFFSRLASSDFNVCCLLVLPTHLHKGYGRLLIDFSYLLSKKCGYAGTPERPLSNDGLLAYRNYWASKICAYLKTLNGDGFNVQELARIECIQPRDIVHTLLSLQMLRRLESDTTAVVKSKEFFEFENKQAKAVLEGKFREIKESQVQMTANMLQIKELAQQRLKELDESRRKPRSRNRRRH